MNDDVGLIVLLFLGIRLEHVVSGLAKRFQYPCHMLLSSIATKKGSGRFEKNISSCNKTCNQSLGPCVHRDISTNDTKRLFL